MSTQSYLDKMPGIESGRRRVTQDTRSTAKAVRGLYRRLGSWKAVADILDKSGAFWWKVAHREITGQTVSKQQRQGIASADPSFLAFVQRRVVPWLKSRQEP